MLSIINTATLGKKRIYQFSKRKEAGNACRIAALMIHNETVNQAIAYILNHITETITVENVAKHCHFSRYHFSRMFKEATGKSVYEFVKHVRMEQSAFRLKVDKEKTVTDIGAAYGYSASNYSVIFKQHHNLSPAMFRQRIAAAPMKNPIFHHGDMTLDTLAQCNEKITVEVLSDCTVIYERHIGNYTNLSENWCAFTEKYNEYMTDDTLLLERTYDDPAITDIDGCLYDICMSAPADCRLPNIDVIKGGKYAVYHFKDSVYKLYAAYQSIYQVWLPESRREIDERYGFECYRLIDDKTMYMEIDLCIPIK